MVKNTLYEVNPTTSDECCRGQAKDVEILDNLQQSFENFLKQYLFSADEDFNAIKKFLENDKRFKVLPQFYNELKLIYNDDKKIKDFIYKGLLESYGFWVDNPKTKLSKNLLVSLIRNKDSHSISHLEKLLIESHIGPEGLRDLTLDEVEYIIKELINYYDELKERDKEYLEYYKNDIETFGNILNELRKKKEYKGNGNFKENTGNQYQIVNTEGIINCIKNGDRDKVNNCLIGTKDHTFNREIFEKLLHNYEYYNEDLMVYIDRFYGLEDSDLIDLYFRLYPDRYEEKRKYDYNNRYQEKGTDNFIIDICINQIDDDGELTDLIDLIKTTEYWTDDVRDKCYDKARKLNMWCYITDNYAMGYFNNKKLIEKDLIENDFKGFRGSLIGYSPLFHDLEKFKDKVKKNTEWGGIANLRNNLYCFRKCVALMENRKKLGNEKGAIYSPRSRHLI